MTENKNQNVDAPVTEPTTEAVAAQKKRITGKQIITILLAAEFMWLGWYAYGNYGGDFQSYAQDTFTSLIEIEREPTAPDQVVVAFADETTSLEPTQNNSTALARLGNIYEGLTTVDRNLRVRPALAVSWSNPDDTTWIFRLREGVKFHDGSDFGSEDVIASFDRASYLRTSDYHNFFANVENYGENDYGEIVFKLKNRDTLFPFKLRNIFVLPSRTIAEKEDSWWSENTVGTGPYALDSWKFDTQAGTNVIKLEAHPDYYRDGIRP